MSDPTAPLRLGNFRVRLRNAYLVHALFADTQSPYVQPAAPANEVPVELRIGLFRPSQTLLTVAVTVTVQLEEPFEVQATYAGEFELDEDVAEDDQERTLQICAAQLAPLVLYPYLRETVMNLTSRARGDTAVLPILSFATTNPEDIKIPPPINAPDPLQTDLLMQSDAPDA